jgi:hypothetical protein
MPDKSNSELVVRTPFGGMALESYIFHFDPEQQKLLFRLNLLEFLRECLFYKARSTPVKPKIPPHKSFLEKYPFPKPVEFFSPPSEPPVPQAGEESRWVLAFYRSSTYPLVENSPIWQYAEFSLNHLGLCVRYWDLDKGLPPQEYGLRYRGILNWYEMSGIPNPEEYIEWLLYQMRNQVKVVVCGDGGFLDDTEKFIPASPRLVRKFFRELGFSYISPAKKMAQKFQVVQQNDDMVGFDERLDISRLRLPPIRLASLQKVNKVHLKVKEAGSGEFEVVATTPRGGVALGNTIFQSREVQRADETIRRDLTDANEKISYVAEEGRAPLCLNLFEFFREAFGLATLPAMDVTTLNGHRIFYSHVDGDGFLGISLIDKSSFSSEILLYQLIGKYDLPITLSVISQEIETNGSEYYNGAALLARSMYERDNVEAGTHTARHPFNWIQGNCCPEKRGGEWVMYTQPTDLDYEIKASVAFINANLLPPNKKLEILL